MNNMMDYLVERENYMRKEAAISLASIGRANRALGAAGDKILSNTFKYGIGGGLGGAVLGGVGGGIGANAAVNAYERKKQQEDPNYKVSKLGRIGAIAGGALGGGSILGLGAMEGVGRVGLNRLERLSTRAKDIATRKGLRFNDFTGFSH